MSSGKISEISNFLGFGPRLRALREKRELTLSQLASRAGFSYAAEISKFENGKIPEVGELQRLAAALGVAPRYLLTGEEGQAPRVGETEEAYERLSRGDRRRLEKVEDLLRGADQRLKDRIRAVIDLIE